MKFDIHQEMARRLGVHRLTAKRALFAATFSAPGVKMPVWILAKIENDKRLANTELSAEQVKDLDAIAETIRPTVEKLSEGDL